MKMVNVKPEFHTELRTMDMDLAKSKNELANVTILLDKIERQKQQLLNSIREKDRTMVAKLKEVATAHEIDISQGAWGFSINDMAFTEVPS